MVMLLGPRIAFLLVRPPLKNDRFFLFFPCRSASTRFARRKSLWERMFRSLGIMISPPEAPPTGHARPGGSSRCLRKRLVERNIGLNPMLLRAWPVPVMLGIAQPERPGIQPEALETQAEWP
jgi:hypothetical protein